MLHADPKAEIFAWKPAQIEPEETVPTDVVEAVVPIEMTEVTTFEIDLPTAIGFSLGVPADNTPATSETQVES
jgi:hypothetical protein